MMLSRTGWGETSLPVAFQTVGGRRAPWGCAAGAPYRGTASPPPPPPPLVCGIGDSVCTDATGNGGSLQSSTLCSLILTKPIHLHWIPGQVQPLSSLCAVLF